MNDRAMVGHGRGLRACLCLAGLLGYLSAAGNAVADEPATVLKGLKFVPGAAAFDVHGVTSIAEPVDVSAVGLLDDPDFAGRMRALIGQTLSLETLKQIVPLATEKFTAAGHPAVAVTIPQQDVSSGIVQVVVTEFTVGQVAVEGAEHFPPDLYRASIGLRAGETVDMDAVQARLRALNESAYHQAEVALRPGSDAGTVDAVIRVQDQSPVTVTAGFNNAGAPTTGKNQWSVGLAVANTIGNLDDVLSYQYATSDFWQRASAMTAHTLTYTINLPGIGVVSMMGSTSLSQPVLDNNLSSKGTSAQLSPSFTRELISREAGQLSLRLGYDYKSTNNNLAFGGTTVTSSYAAISQFDVAALVNETDRLGHSDAQLSLVASPGHMLPDNIDARFRSLSASARAQYAYLRLDVTRSTVLWRGLTLWAHGVGQIADGGLLPSEQLNAGGAGTVRGYPTSTLRGDAGYLFSAELRWPVGGISPLLGHDIGDGIEPFVFFDHAAVRARRATGQPATDGSLASLGPGVRFNIGQYLVITLDTGAQLRIDGGRHYPAQFVDVSVGLRY